MIVSRAPLRVSLFGGGSDFRDYFYKKKSHILTLAINHYVYVIIKKRFDSHIYINWSKKREICKDVYSIEHELIKESLLKAEIFDGVEITCLY